MFTIRFPDGVAITYEASFLKHTQQTFELYTKDPENGGSWVASIPVSTHCIIEAARPCRVENPVAGLTDDAAAVMVLKNLHNLGHRRLKELKQALKTFNAKSYEWVKS